MRMTRRPLERGEGWRGLIAALAVAPWRARRTIAAVTVAAAVVAGVGVAVMPPLHRAEARLMFALAPVRPDATGLARGRADAELEARIRLIGSRDLARRVVARNHLDLADLESGLASGWRRLAAVAGAPAPAAGEDAVLDAFVERLEVVRIEATPIVRIAFAARDRDLAVRTADAVAEEVIEAATEADVRAAAEATRRAGDEIDALRRRLAEAETALALNRPDAAVTGSVADLSARLDTERAHRTELDARTRKARRLLERGALLDAATELADVAAVERPRDRLRALRTRAAELDAVYLADHPLVRTVTADIAETERQLRAELGKALAVASTDLSAVDARIRDLAARIEAASAPAGSTDVAALERAVAEARTRLDDRIARTRDDTDGAPRIDARRIEPARAVDDAEAIGWAGSVGRAALAVGLLAVLGAMLPVLRARRRFAAEPLEAPSVAGTVPVDGRIAAAASEPDDAAPLPRRSRGPREASSAASIERIWSAIAAAPGDGRRLVVASATSDRAARLAALALMRVAARAGGHVCLIDLVDDGRDLAGVAGPAAPHGLSDLLADTASFADVIFRDRVSRGHVVARGRRRLTAAALAGEALDNALAAFALTYEHLVLDVGRLRTDDGIARLVASADAVVLAADGSGRDPATQRAHEALVEGGFAEVWLLAVDDAGEERVERVDLAA